MNTPTDQPQPKPDTFSQAGELLAVFADGKRIATGHVDRDNALLFAVQLYTIADQLRRIADAQEASRE